MRLALVEGTMRSILAILVTAACSSTPSHPTHPAPIGQLEQGMRNCPSAVDGAVTKLRNQIGGVDLIITADAPVAQRRILELARLHARLGDPDGSAMEHTGRHGGPGDIGHCPVVHAATTVSVTPLPNGATIHIRALLAGDVRHLQTVISDRVARLAVR
jgi:hypothetical protein